MDTIAANDGIVLASGKRIGAAAVLASGREYIFGTLSSMGKRWFPSLVILSDVQHPNLVRATRRFGSRLVTMTPDEDRERVRLAKRGPHARGNYFWCWALGQLQHANADHGVLVVEDDVWFADTWGEILCAAIDAAEEEAARSTSSGYVLSGFCPFGREAVEPSTLITEHPVSRLSMGTQMLYFPQAVLNEWASYVSSRMRRDSGHGLDTWLSEFCRATERRLFYTCPSTVQHVGSESTGPYGVLLRAPDGPTPHFIPHFYQSIDGWFGFEDIYAAEVDRAQSGARFVEVGCWLGRSTAYLAVEIARSGKGIELSCVDTFAGTKGDDVQTATSARHGGSVRERFEEAMLAGGVADRIKVIEAESTVAATRFPDESLDFVFIDADHHYEAVACDIAAWAPKVRPGGTLAGDDHTAEYPGVVRAVTEAFSGYDSERTIRGRAWYYRKPTMDFCVAVTTAPRDQDYLAATLGHVLRGAGTVHFPMPIRVCVSGDASAASGLADKHADLHGLVFEAARPEAWPIVEQAGPRRRCCANTWQALAGAHPGMDVLLLQDDVELSCAWPQHLRFRARAAEAKHGKKFILALYAAYRFPGRHIADYPARMYYGNQAVYFPSFVASEYAAFLWAHGVEQSRYPDDLALQAYATQAHVPIVVALPNLAQHVGRVTTGLGRFHSSPTFRTNV